MKQPRHYYYFVEGENEEKLVDILKSEFQVIPTGKVDKFNVLTHRLTKARLLGFERNSVIVFIFDTDDQTVELDILYENERLLKNCPSVKDYYCITQVKNIEDELIRSTDIKKIEELLPSKGKKGFKNDFNRIRANIIARKLNEHHFDFALLWSQRPMGKFSEIHNDSGKIKNRY